MNILITGVSKGLGLALTESLLSKGHTVFGLSRSRTVELKKLQSLYDNFLWKEYDLIDVDNISLEVFKNFIGANPIHGFINNAALAYDDIITNANMAKLQAMFAVNVYSPINLVKYTIRNMMLHKVSGSIVHISSISVHTGYKGLSMYAATKGALEAFSRNTAREWGGLKIRSNTIVAGFMDTEMSSTLDGSQKARIYARTSLKKPVNPISVAAMVNLLLNEGSESITGQNIHVDSGTI